MLKDKTLKQQASDHFSINDLEFLTKLNSQQLELIFGGQYYHYGYDWSPEADRIYRQLQGTFRNLPDM